jgi:hypothetical protein
MSVAMVCLYTNLAAQTNNGNPPGVVVVAASPQVIRLEEPGSAGRGKLLLQWSVPPDGPKGYFTIERSAFIIGPFEVIGLMKQESSFGKFIDEQPLRGANFYRAKWVQESGTEYISRVVNSSHSGDMSCKFYPNPVDNVLIVRSEQSLELILTDGTGKQRLAAKLKAGLQTVDVSALDKGLYIITLTQPDTGHVLTEKLVKN